MSNKNYFSTRITLNERLVEVGLSPTASGIQRVGELYARIASPLTYPGDGDDSFVSSPKGTLSISTIAGFPKGYGASTDLSGHIRLQDPSSTMDKVGVSVPIPGTLGYFAVDKIPEGWFEIGNPNEWLPHKTITGYTPTAAFPAGDPLLPITANTEYTRIYEILDSYNLVETVRRAATKFVFNTKDPFRGYFVRSLNPSATGVDPLGIPLQTQEKSIPTHSHEAYNFPTYIEPSNVYHASNPGTITQGAPYTHSFTVDKYYKQSGNTTSPWMINPYDLSPIGDINAAPPPAAPAIPAGTFPNLIPTTLYYRDELTLEYRLQPTTSTSNKPHPITIGKMGYDGFIEPVGDEEIEYKMKVGAGAFTSYFSFSTFETDFFTYTDPAAPSALLTIQVIFKPKKLLSGTFYVFNTGAKSTTAPTTQTFNLYSSENSPIIDRGRLPFHTELVDYGNLRLSPVGEPTHDPTVRPIPGPHDYRIGNYYVFNYKYMFGHEWNAMNDGSKYVNYESWNQAPFDFVGDDGRPYSFTAWDNHLHTRVETYYRSIAPSTISSDTNKLYGKVVSATSPAFSSGISSDYWFERHISIENKLPPKVNPGTAGGVVPPNSGLMSSDPFNAAMLAKNVGYAVNPGHPVPHENVGITAEKDVTYSTPYWLSAYAQHLTVWPTGSEYYERNSLNLNPSDFANLPNSSGPSYVPAGYTKISRNTVTAFQQGTIHPYYKGYYLDTTYVWRWTQPRTISTAKGPIKGSDTRFQYGGGSAAATTHEGILRRTWRTRVMGPRQTFALRRKIATADSSVHILKSPLSTPLGTEFYNSGDDGALALRTSYEGDHRHQFAHDESYYRGEDDFRPINIALRLCMKF